MGKLVRDRIPEIIRQAGKTCTVRPLTAPEYQAALRDKLIEEAQEVVAPDADLVTELADLCEVMTALMEVNGLTWETVTATQSQRRDQRGGFAHRLWLESVEDSAP